MVFGIPHACFHGGDQRQLLFINVFNQLRILTIAIRRPGTGQICGVAVIFRPGIQQEAAHFRGRTVIKFGVVQHGGMFIQRHDIAVRDIGIAMTGRGQIGLIDIEFAHPREECLMCRLMTVYRRFLRFTHAGQLIVRFIRAVVMQIVDHAFRIEVGGGDVHL